MTDTTKLSIATGAILTPETFEEFKQRLHYDCRGEGVRDHGTANAVFTVQEKRMITGLDAEYGEKLVYDNTGDFMHWFSPQEYWDDLDDEERDELEIHARNLMDDPNCTFIALDVEQQWDVLEDLPTLDVGYYTWQWKYINGHLTKAAAEAFIKRKQHDYGELRIFVESSYWCWELNEIRDAILDGRLVLKEAV